MVVALVDVELIKNLIWNYDRLDIDIDDDWQCAYKGTCDSCIGELKNIIGYDVDEDEEA